MAKMNMETGSQAAWLAFCLAALAGCGPVSNPSEAAVNPGIAPGPQGGPLAAKYRGDVGIERDPAVVWREDFEESSVAAFVERYSSHANISGMRLVADRPQNSLGAHALELIAGGSHPATDFYKSFGAGYDELYFRYYAKYVGRGPWHHSGLWIGGYNPPIPFTYPRAGRKPAGNDLFSIGLEPIPLFTNVPMDLYTYWMGMHSWKPEPTGAVGDYYGNTLLHDAAFLVQSDAWICYEIHLKVNPDPSSARDAELEVWQNDSLVRRFDDKAPLGYWIRDKFCPLDAKGSECTAYRPANPIGVLLDQRWRSTSALKINYFWPQNYNTDSTNSSLLMDDLVVATQRIGCMSRR
jgi:hypothetical protein